MGNLDNIPVIPPVDPGQNMLKAFLAETFKRITAKTPVFFKYWKIITGVLTVIAAAPQLLNQAGFAISDPTWLKVCSLIGLGAHAMTYLSAQSTTVGTTQPDDNLPLPTGTPLKVTDAANLPFTAAKELSNSITTKP